MTKRKQKKKGRRRSLRLGGGPQVSLFEQAPPQPSETAVRRGRPTFVEPSPYELYIGAERLDVFLETTGQSWVMEVRDLLESLDWSSFEDKYSMKGRRPYHPMLMLGLVLMGVMEGVTSLRQLETRARRDVAWRWVTGGIAPDHSIIGRFLQLHSDELSEGFFERLTRAVIDTTGSSAASVSGDGTTVQAAASAYRTLKQDSARQAAEQARKDADDDPEDPGAAARADRAEHVVKVVEERVKARRAKGKRNAERAQVCPSEPDAVFQKMKNKSFAPAYKSSVLATEERIIVGHGVHPTSESALVETMLGQATRVGTKMPSRLLLDAGYFGSRIIALALAHDIDLLCPHGRSFGDGKWEKTAPKLPGSEFVFDEANNRYLCPDGRELRRVSHSKGTNERVGYTLFRSTDCAACPRLSACTRNGTRRTLKRYDDEEAKEALKQVMRHPQARARYRKRSTSVEPVFAELRGRQNLRRFSRRGLSGAQLEFALHAIAHNIRRMLALRSRAECDPAPSQAARSPRSARQAISARMMTLFQRWLLPQADPAHHAIQAGAV